MRKSAISVFVSVMFALILISCSDGATAPPLENQVDDTGLTGQADGNGRVSPHYLWGYFLGYYDPDEGTFELQPVRDASTHYNVLKFLEVGPCTDCVSITGVSFTPDDTLLVDFTIDHPFAGMNFSGFDVRGILMFDGSHNFPVADVVTSDSDLGEGEVLNADGYTTLYNFSTEGSGPGGLQGYFEGKIATSNAPDATLNGFKRFVTTDILNNRNAFYAGDSITVQYEVALPGGPMVFGYAVDANWVPPTDTPVTNPSADFPPEANSPEAWNLGVYVEETSNTLRESGGSATIKIRIFDYEGPSSYKVPVVECPELFDGQVQATQVAVNAKFADYEAVVTNSKNAVAETYECLIRVKENAADSSPPYLNLTAYQIVDLEVADLSGIPPFAEAVADKYSAEAGEIINFNASGSHDQDNNQKKIVLYQWDFDGDGVYDEEGMNLQHQYAYDGVYEVQLKVTDDEGDSDTLDRPLVIDVSEHGYALSWGGTDNEFANCIGMDSDSNLYIGGGFAGVVDFEYGPGETLAEADSFDAYIMKLDPYGNLLWVTTWGGSGGEEVEDLTIDPAGYIFACGSLSGTNDLDPGPGLQEHISVNYDAYISSFTTDGDWRWAKVITATAKDLLSDIGLFSDGSVCTSGYTNSLQIDLDPGPGTDLKAKIGGNDPIVIKFDRDGNQQWSRLWGGTLNEIVTDMAVDSLDNVDITGYFDSADIDFNPEGSPEVYASSGFTDDYLLQLDSDGNFNWVQAWGDLYIDNVGALSVFSSGSIFVTGLFTGTVDFDPGADTDEHTPVGDTDMFLVKYGSGGVFQWARTWGGDLGESGHTVDANDTGNIYVSGSFGSNNIDMDPGPGEKIFASHGESDIGISHFDAAGNFIGAVALGAGSEEYSIDIIADSEDRIFMVGFFQDVGMDFDPGPGVDMHFPTGGGGAEAYMVKFMPDLSWGN